MKDTLPDVIVLRGLPGSGKSTYAQILKATHRGLRVKIVSADDHFVDPATGEYRFDPAGLRDAHAHCLLEYLDWLNSWYDSRTETMIVDNTNVSAWEAAPYVQVVLAHGLTCRVVTIHCDPATAACRNVHGVPARKVWEMHARMMFEVLPSHWDHAIVFAEMIPSVMTSAAAEEWEKAGRPPRFTEGGPEGGR